MLLLSSALGLSENTTTAFDATGIGHAICRMFAAVLLSSLSVVLNTDIVFLYKRPWHSFSSLFTCVACSTTLYATRMRPDSTSTSHYYDDSPKHRNHRWFDWLAGKLCTCFLCSSSAETRRDANNTTSTITSSHRRLTTSNYASLSTSLRLVGSVSSPSRRSK